jgi:hypothetical protein
MDHLADMGQLRPIAPWLSRSSITTELRAVWREIVRREISPNVFKASESTFDRIDHIFIIAGAVR